MDTNRIYKRVFLQLALFGFGINNSIIIVFSQKLYCLHFRTIRIPFEEESSGLEEKVL